MPAPQRDDPFKSFAFLVEIDGIAQAAFSEVSGLESETAVIGYRLGNECGVRKLPGLTKFGNIVLRRGITNGGDPKPVPFGLGPGRAAPVQTDDDAHTAVPKVLGMGVALAAVTDDGHGFPPQRLQRRILVVVDGGH